MARHEQKSVFSKVDYQILTSIMRHLVFNKVSTLSSKRVVDVGCGKGAWGSHMRFVKGVKSADKVGIDIFKPYLKYCKKLSLYNEVILADVKHLPFRGRVFDFVLSVFVLEHLNKEDGTLFLKEVERVCHEVFVVVTEHGYKPDEISVPLHALKLNPYLHHLSGWTYRELREKGFAVRGINFVFARQIRHPFNLIFFIFIAFAYIFPQLADKLIFWKYVDARK